MPSFQAHMGNYDSNDPADSTRKGWLTSILELGAWLGTLLSGFMAESLSRKYGILIATAVFIIGVVVQATAITAGHNAILGGRFIT
jgi:MFS family permease